MGAPTSILALLLSGAAGAATVPPAPVELPQPGLYRIDTDGSMAFSGNPVQARIITDGANGDTTAHMTAGERSATRQYPGTAPLTHCLKSKTATLPPQALACTVESMTRTSDGFIQAASCPFGKLNLTVHRLGKDRWEFLSDVTMVTTGAGPDLTLMKPLLEQQVLHGETAEAREAARQQLAQLPRMQRQSDASYAEQLARIQEQLRKTTNPDEKAALQAALARLRPGTPVMRSHGRAVWTRIADACGGAP